MTRALLCVTAAVALGLPGAPARAQARQEGTTLLTETFTGVDAPEFIGYNEACLTGAEGIEEDKEEHGAHDLRGCEEAEAGPVPPLDAAPYGYLRLTDAGPNRSAAVMYNHPLPANGGLDVTFDAWQYGTTTPPYPADGISFFLTDGATDLTEPGAFGGSLGYAKKKSFAEGPTKGLRFNGVAGGYLGVGMDVYGNYFADTEERGETCQNQRSPAGPPDSDAVYYERGPNMISVRGPGNGFNGYCYITGTTNYPHSQPPSKPWPSNLGLPPINGSLQGPTTSLPSDVTPQQAVGLLEVSRRHFNVRLTPTPDPRLIVTVDLNNGTGPHQVLNIPAPLPVPPTYKFGFAASTGGATDVHLIRNVTIASDRPLHELNLVKQVRIREEDGQEQRPAYLREGQELTYQYVVTNASEDTITDLRIPDQEIEAGESRRIGPVTCWRPAPPPAPGATQTEELYPGETITCTAPYTVTLQDVDRGYITNTAVAEGKVDDEDVFSPPATEHIPAVGLSIHKQATEESFSAPDTVLHYTYTVTNTGDVPLYNVAVHDDKAKPDPERCKWDELPPVPLSGSRVTCTGTYETTDADVRAGGVTNVAHVSAEVEHEDGTRTPLKPEPEDTQTVPAEVLSLSCPDFGPVDHTDTGTEIEGSPGSTLTLPAGPCTLRDGRGSTGGQWTVDAQMDHDFCITAAPTVCLTGAEVRYIVPTDQITVLNPAGIDPATEMNNAAKGTVQVGPPWDAPPADEPEGGVTLNGRDGPAKLVLGTMTDHNVYEARWNPYLAVKIPEDARPTLPGEEYLGTITYTVS